MSGREQLPGRRQNLSRRLEYEGQRFTVTIGYFPDGRPGEVFVSGHKHSLFDRVMSDACVMISRGLQAGLSVAELAESLGTVPTLIDGRFTDGPASPIGLVLGEMVERPELVALKGDPGK